MKIETLNLLTVHPTIKSTTSFSTPIWNDSLS
jgi:hypothetical protein